jgi:hypothetical protein
MSIEKKAKPKYPQPHNIHFFYDLHAENPALAERETSRSHVRAKYEAKYRASKQSKRGYGDGGRGRFR